VTAQAQTTSTEPQIRRAAGGEAGAITEVFLAARREAMSYLPELHTRAQTQAYFRDHVLARSTVWVAGAGGALVGFLALRDRWVEHLYVRPGHYRRGLGSRLLSLAKQASPEGLRLYAFQRNKRARAFYEAHGFKAIQLTNGFANEEKEPDVLYEWRPASEPGRLAAPQQGPLAPM